MPSRSLEKLKEQTTNWAYTAIISKDGDCIGLSQFPAAVNKKAQQNPGSKIIQVNSLHNLMKAMAHAKMRDKP